MINNHQKSIFYFIMAFMLLMTGCVKRHDVIYVEDLKIEQPEILEDFKEIHHIIKENYSFFSHKGIDPDSLFSAFYSQIKAVQNGEEYIRILLQYFAELENGHTNLALRRYEINNWAKILEDRLYLSHVFDESFREKGIQPKDEIVEINHISAMEWLNQEMSYVSASTIVGSLETARINVFQSYFPEERSYLIRTDEGLKEVSVVFRKPEPFKRKSSAGAPRSLIESRAISDSIGYISIALMQERALLDFPNAFNDVKDKPYLIIDIRNNVGGNSPRSEQIASYLLKHPHKACVSKKTLSPRNDNYKGTLFLLISGLTSSAAESFVIDLKEGAQAILVGKPTGGDTGSGPRFFTTKNNIRFRAATQQPYFSAQGFPMEGKSIEPHYHVEETLDDFFEGRDVALDFIINLIEQGKY
jgi:carboxyl-terminal processing protease